MYNCLDKDGIYNTCDKCRKCDDCTCYIKIYGAMGPPGEQGVQGLTGAMGAMGPPGIQGPIGLIGPQGVQGLIGAMGPPGIQGLTGLTGAMGPPGIQGLTGLTGATGVQGTSGINAIVNFADFYSLMPPDNAATVAVGTSVSFTTIGPAQGNIVKINNTQFSLPSIGIYEILFQVSVDESGQLVVVLNGSQIPYTVMGRATGTSQIIGYCLIQTLTINSILSINNPTGNSTALTITPLAGGANSVSTHLIIKQLA